MHRTIFKLYNNYYKATHSNITAIQLLENLNFKFHSGCYDKLLEDGWMKYHSIFIFNQDISQISIESLHKFFMHFPSHILF